MVSNFDNDLRRKHEIAMRPIVNRVYDYVWPGCAYQRFDKSESVLDIKYGIDVKVTLPNGMALFGQEKVLRADYRHYETVTVEYYNVPKNKIPGDWFHLAAQFYFCGYANVAKTTITPWVLLDWPAIILATQKGLLRWSKPRDNSMTVAQANFRHIRMVDIPDRCIIAKWGRFKYAKAPATS